MRIDGRALIFVVLAGCGIDAVGALAGGPGGDGGSPSSDGGAPAADGGDGDGGVALDGGGDSETPPPALFYVSTASKLYTYAPLTKTLTFVADVASPCGEMDDLAVDSKGSLWGINGSSRELYEIDPTTYACSRIGVVAQTIYSLAFVPKATFGTADDVLVGYENRAYVRIERDATSSVVNQNALDFMQSPSGDLAVMGSRMFVSVTGSTECNTDDCLMEVDPKTGSIVQNWGHFPGIEVFALAQWAGKLYGFQSTGTILEVTLASPLAFAASDGGGSLFLGAASSPRAPIQ